ncbi:hypothetical protein VTI74DRAFT_3810 [Chaetomium olivicolor]
MPLLPDARIWRTNSGESGDRLTDQSWSSEPGVRDIQGLSIVGLFEGRLVGCSWEHEVILTGKLRIRWRSSKNMEVNYCTVNNGDRERNKRVWGLFEEERAINGSRRWDRTSKAEKE